MGQGRWLILLLIVATACNTNTDQQASEAGNIGEDSIAVETGNELNEQTIVALDELPVIRFTKSNTRDFKWNSFQLTRFWTEDSMLTRPFNPGAGYFENYGALLKYSPDSSKFIDLDSYNISITRNANGELIGRPQGPDTEVSMVDLEKKQSIRLVFLGPGNNIEDASWLDKENLILISSVDNADAKANASIIKYNLPSKTFNVYETTDTSIVNKLKGYWKNERLKQVTMR